MIPPSSITVPSSVSVIRNLMVQAMMIPSLPLDAVVRAAELVAFDVRGNQWILGAKGTKPNEELLSVIEHVENTTELLERAWNAFGQSGGQDDAKLIAAIEEACKRLREMLEAEGVGVW